MQGSKVLTAAEAARNTNVIMMLVPDEYAAKIYKTEVVRTSKKALTSKLPMALISITDRVVPPARIINVFMVALKRARTPFRGRISEKERSALPDCNPAGPLQEYKRPLPLLMLLQSEAAG